MNRIILLSFFLVSIFSSTTMAASCPSGTGIATPTTWAAFSTAAADPTISSICVDASIAPTLTLTSGTNTLILTRQSPAPPLTIYTVNGVVAIDGASSYRLAFL